MRPRPRRCSGRRRCPTPAPPAAERPIPHPPPTRGPTPTPAGHRTRARPVARDRLRGGEALLVAPQLEGKRTLRGLQLFHLGPGQMPPGLLVRASGPQVADGAAEPGGLDAAGEEPALRIGHELPGETGAAGLGRDVELVELVALQDRESKERTHRADGPGLWERGTEPLLEPGQRAAPRQLRGDDGRVRVLPPVVPEASQVSDLRRIYRPHLVRRVAG